MKELLVKHKILVFAVLGFFILLGPILFTSFSLFGLDFTETGQIGDTIGGITAPFINLLAAFLVFASFQEQIKANRILSNEVVYNQIYNFLNDFLKDKETKQELKNKLLNLSSIDNSFKTSVKGILSIKDASSQIKFDELEINISTKLNYASDYLFNYIVIIERINKSDLNQDIKKVFLNRIKDDFNKVVLNFENNFKSKDYPDLKFNKIEDAYLILKDRVKLIKSFLD